MWAWIEVILLWRLKGVALNLLRPGDNEKSLGFYGGGGVRKLFGEVCIIHMTKIIENYCIGAARFWQAQAIPPNRLRIFVKCKSIYRCMSRAECHKSPTLIRKCFEKYPHAAQHVFYISACYDCKSSLSVSLGQGPRGPSRFTNSFFDFGELTAWTVNVTSPRQFKSRYVC